MAGRQGGTGAAPLFELEGLRVAFPGPRGPVEAVRGVDLSLGAGEVLAVVGESGSGKSVTMLAALGLVPRSVTVGGSARFRGEELVGAPPRRLRALRGAAVSMIFQDPLSALNPVLRIGEQIAEAIRLHRPGMGRRAVAGRVVELLETVSIPEPERRARQFPHEFSGGMRQRAMIAMAIANDPELLIADEPTTALDVTVQAQIMEVLRELRARLGLALVLITHDLGVVAGNADRVVVLYAGRVVEEAPVEALFAWPRHPYTCGLIDAVPRLDGRVDTLTAIEGAPPQLGSLPGGCSFHPRCPMARERCRQEEPALRPVGAGRSACHFAEEIPPREAAAAEAGR